MPCFADSARSAGGAVAPASGMKSGDDNRRVPGAAIAHGARFPRRGLLRDRTNPPAPAADGRRTRRRSALPVTGCEHRTVARAHVRLPTNATSVSPAHKARVTMPGSGRCCASRNRKRCGPAPPRQRRANARHRSSARDAASPGAGSGESLDEPASRRSRGAAREAGLRTAMISEAGRGCRTTFEPRRTVSSWERRRRISPTKDAYAGTRISPSRRLRPPRAQLRLRLRGTSARKPFAGVRMQQLTSPAELDPPLDADGVQERGVVADDEQGAVVAAQHLLQRLQAVQVQVVGRLVQQQQAGRMPAVQRARQRRPQPLARRSASRRAGARRRPRTESGRARGGPPSRPRPGLAAR